MDPAPAGEVLHDFRPFFKVYTDGRVERYKMFHDVHPVPPGTDSKTGVHSKDVIINPETGVSARMFIPAKINPEGPETPNSLEKLPLFVHFHGGGFCAGSPFDTVTWNFLTTMVSLTNIVAMSVDYRLAPEHPLPIGYEDAVETLCWISSHMGGSGPEPWLNKYADLGRVFLTGESAGGNIAQYAVTRAGARGLSGSTGLKIKGLLAVHPFFGGSEVDEMYKFLCPGSSGLDDDPKLNPAVDPELSKMEVEKVLVCVAERDWLRNRGVKYYEALCKTEWKGKVKVEFDEAKEEDHCFHMFKKNEKAEKLINRFIDFINQD